MLYLRALQGHLGRNLIDPSLQDNVMIPDTLFQEVTDHHNQKDGSREAQKLDPCWKLRPVACMVNKELKLEFGL